MRALAARSVGQARAAMTLAAAQTAGDYELREGGIANSGAVEAVAPLSGHAGEYVVVTRESTSASNTTAYQGLRPAWHLALATVERSCPAALGAERLAARELSPTGCPFAVSVTSMLPRVAFEYGQTSCAAGDDRLASSASVHLGELTSSSTATLKPRSSVVIRLTLLSIEASPTSAFSRRAATPSAPSKQAA